MTRTLAILALAMLIGGRAPAAFVAVIGSSRPEDQPLMDFVLQRSGPGMDATHSVDYSTEDGTAKAGRDYVATAGTVTFAPFQVTATVGVPLIDNAVVELDRSFALRLQNYSPGLEPGGICHFCSVAEGLIQDNELDPAVDPHFVPAATPDSNRIVLELLDGRIVVSSDGSYFPVGTKILRPDGSLDRHVRDLGEFNSLLLRALADGGWLSQADNRIVRYSARGQVERTVVDLPAPGFASSSFFAARPDGRLLLISNDRADNSRDDWVIHQLDPSGASDAAFKPASVVPAGDGWTHWPQATLEAAGTMLIAGSFQQVNGVPRAGLARLNPDGTLDTGFAPVLARPSGRTPEIHKLLIRPNGKVLVTGMFRTVNGTERCCLAQINPDGSLDPNFNPPPEIARWDANWEEGVCRFAEAVLPDGPILVPGPKGISRLREDGAWDPTKELKVGWVGEVAKRPRETLTTTASGDVLLSGQFNRVDGFPAPGFARILSKPPEKDFRVIAGTEFPQAGGMALLQVVRTGTSSNAATVSYATSDGTARSGHDYEARSGTLSFAPLEVSKDVLVPLLNSTGSTRRITFNLQLSDPSPGYSVVPSTPVGIVRSGLWLRAQAVNPPDGMVHLELQGTVPGRAYVFERSSDLLEWWGTGTLNAQGTSLGLGLWAGPETNRPVFFRARAR